MTSEEAASAMPARSRLWRFAVVFIRTLRRFGEAMLIAWAALAVYYSNLPLAWLRAILAVGLAGFGIWALWLTRRRLMPLAFAVVFIGIVVWWSFILPSHDRPWRKDVAVMPTARIDGDRVRLSGVRNFSYRTRDDFDVRYEEREVSLSHLQSIDFFISYWMPGPIGHTFLSFNFDNAAPVSISIALFQ